MVTWNEGGRSVSWGERCKRVSHAYQSVMKMPAMKLTRNCAHFRLMAVEKPHMVTRNSLWAYSRYNVSMECAMGLRCCRPVSHPSIPSKPDSLVLLLLLFMIMPVASMCTAWTERLTFLRTLDLLQTVFTDTTTYVDCSKSYSLDAYSQKEIKGINSQVNKQANLGLQKIWGH